MKHYNIPIFISHFGCPNDCVFCNQRKINGRETDVTIEDVKNIIERYLETLPKKSKIEVAFFGGTFTGISLKLQEEYLKVVYPYIEQGIIDGVRVSTRPDCIDDKILTLLSKYGVKTIELGVQSLDEDVLKKTKRFYPTEQVYRASKLIKEYGIKLGIQLMLGLPGATERSDLESAQKVLEIDPNIVRIYPTLVIKETEMARMYERGEYIPLTIEEAIQRCKKIYSLIEYKGINIIRVGLQPTDELNDTQNVLGGPFHPAFRELVLNEIYYDFISTLDSGDLNIEVNERNVSKIIGLNKRNLKRIKNRVKILINNNLSQEDIHINGKLYNWKEILKFEIENINHM